MRTKIYIIQLCSGIMRRRVLSAQGFQKLIYLQLFTDCLMKIAPLTPKVLVTTIDAQWEGMGDVGSARYEPALLAQCPTIRVLTYSN